MATAVVKPLKDVRVETHHIAAHGHTPNTGIQNRPLLIYRAAFPPDAAAAPIEAHLAATGVVAPQWRHSMYRASHFHSTTHEVLCVWRGAARLCFGHEGNAARVETEVRAGDVVVVPAGVAHRLLEDRAGGDFEMVGAYPVGGRQWDMCYGREGEDAARIAERIAAVPWFERDPIYGDQGPVLEV